MLQALQQSQRFLSPGDTGNVKSSSLCFGQKGLERPLCHLSRMAMDDKVALRQCKPAGNCLEANTHILGRNCPALELGEGRFSGQLGDSWDMSMA